MKKILLGVVAVVILLGGGFYLLNSYIYNEKQAVVAVDYKSAEFLIEGQRVQLENGVAEIEMEDGAAATVRYFGNEITTDLDGDGRQDMAFIITVERGASTFFYAVAAVNTEAGFIGSDGFPLGENVAPQSSGLSPNPRHVRVVVFNYAVRAEDASQPSLGKSAYLKLDRDSMRWGIVEPDFEGEAR